MNSHQRRKHLRHLLRTPFQVSFKEDNQRSVRDFFNEWTKVVEEPTVTRLDLEKATRSTVPKGVVKPLTVEQLESFKETFRLTPKEILNPDVFPMLSNPLAMDLIVSFDYDQHARYKAAKSLAEADLPVDVQPGSVGVTHSDSGTVPDQ